jgi:hypothetical protein
LPTVISFAEYAMLAVASIDTSHSPAMAIEEDKPSTAIEPTIVFNMIFTLYKEKCLLVL